MQFEKTAKLTFKNFNQMENLNYKFNQQKNKAPAKGPALQ
jgi:hypothetical protein